MVIFRSGSLTCKSCLLNACYAVEIAGSLFQQPTCLCTDAVASLQRTTLVASDSAASDASDTPLMGAGTSGSSSPRRRSGCNSIAAFISFIRPFLKTLMGLLSKMANAAGVNAFTIHGVPLQRQRAHLLCRSLRSAHDAGLQPNGHRFWYGRLLLRRRLRKQQKHRQRRRRRRQQHQRPRHLRCGHRRRPAASQSALQSMYVLFVALSRCLCTCLHVWSTSM